MRGPKPIPDEIKAARGNPGMRRLTFSAPIPAGELPPCPKTLDRAARREWARVVKAMPAGVLRSVDLGILAIFCQAFARWSEAECQVGLNGLVSDGHVSPYVNAAHKYREQAMKAAAELGFTPSARMRLRQEPASRKQSGILDLIARSKSA
jgi:P27 family predicted phage terminase small subunit